VRISIWNKRAQAGAVSHRQEAAGFTLIETVIAMLVLMIGLLGLAAAISFSLKVSNRGRSVTNTKLLIASVLEQMEMLRNTQQLTFGQIANVGGVDNTGANRTFGGFPSGFQQISIDPGPDGIIGTGDDLVNAGPDGVYGTGDDYTAPPPPALQGFTREILITSLSPTLKRVQVTLRTPGASGDVQTLVGVSYLNDNARSNFAP
jgi:type II secretory pathway pseudopilin PulG